jgi:pSer/pThr/pTyr-binding forkhead associated (FHA) protein
MAGAGLILLIGITTILILVRKKRTPALYPQPFPSQPSVWQPEQRVLQPSLSVASKGGQQQVTDNDPSSTMVIQRPKYGAIRFISGQLTGQVFEIGMDGLIIGRNSNSKIVINDSRVSKKHLWVGPRNGHVIIEDTSSTNGTFLNNPSAGRVKEAIISPGDAVIVSEPDVAQFIYQA